MSATFPGPRAYRSDASTGYTSYYNVYGALKCSDCRLDWKTYQTRKVNACRHCYDGEAVPLVEVDTVDRRDLIALATDLRSLIARIYRVITQVPRTALRRRQNFGPLGPRFGDYERVEEAKFHPARGPAPQPLEPRDLPESYGQTRIVLLPVNPYLVHAYWEVTPSRLEEVRDCLSDGHEEARGTLRFYETVGMVSGAVNGRSRFDIDIDLQTRNWYVHLWGPEKSYWVDLGLRAEDGRFVALARSNVVQTPPAWPAVNTDDRYMLVETEQRGTDGIPTPLDSIAAKASTGALPETRPAGLDFADAATSKVTARPPDSVEILRRKLAELFAFRGWAGPLLRFEEPARPDIPVSTGEETGVDLTEMSENNLAFGISSDRPKPDPSAQRAKGAGS